MGERAGPVRAIREIWGADSGTNVTNLESFYRDAITYHYHVRVHPIPPDGLYTSWDYNRGVVSKFYNRIKGATTAENPAVVPYYRDDSCLDDGTGDNPVPRPWPGESSDDTRVTNGYCAAGKPNGCHVCRSATDTGPCDVDCKLGQTQGAYAAHGIHYFFSSDTDNLQSPEALTEIDAQQWQFMVPTQQPTNV